MRSCYRLGGKVSQPLPSIFISDVHKVYRLSLWRVGGGGGGGGGNTLHVNICQLLVLCKVVYEARFTSSLHM